MLAGIIKEKNNNYYFHLNEVENKYELDVIKISGFSEVHLTLNEVYKLLVDTFTSKMTFDREINDYKIYIDEAGNERFFKDGKEDYKLLFLKNGIDAKRYITRIYKDEVDDDILECKFINTGTLRKMLVSMVSLTMILNGTVLYVAGGKEKIHSKLYNEVYGILDSDKLMSIVDNSALDNKAKKVIGNKSLLEDVITYSLSENDVDNSYEDIVLRNYDLYLQFNNLNIKGFAPASVAAAGYYSPADPGNIYLVNTIDEEKYDDILAHEYAHMLQVQTSYQYLCESSAELISSEYYNTIPDGYVEEVKRLKVLMEIVGPEPVLNFNFKRNDSSLYQAIGAYLSDEERALLYSQFATVPADWGDEEKGKLINDTIDNLLAKMYYNKTGEDIKKNKVISLIYQGNNAYNVDSDRIYFNKNHENYGKDLCVSETREGLDYISIEDALEDDEFLRCDYYKVQELSNSFDKDFVYNNQLWRKDFYEPQSDAVLIEKDNNYFVKQYGVEYNIDEALNFDLLIKKTLICTREELPHFDFIKGRMCDHVDFVFKDGRIARFIYNSSTSSFDLAEYYKINREYYPSIDKIFSNQERTRQI